MDEYNSAKQYITRQLRDNKRVVFTHGVYDLLHIGHLETLEKSKSFGDILVVGVDADNFVKKRKGDSRPIISASGRLRMISALKCVDYAFIINPYSDQINSLDLFYLELYKYLAVNVVTVGEPSENKDKIFNCCEECGAIFEVAGDNMFETTTCIISRIRK